MSAERAITLYAPDSSACQLPCDIAMPSSILFAQHGWADTHSRIAHLAARVAPPDALLVAPDLGVVRTWLRIEPLIADIERVATETLAVYPDRPVQVIGHSMGGLIWIETLARHPDWWPRVTALVLLGVPVDGSHYGRMVDPLGLGIGIARDLSISRVAQAETLAAAIPTLSIAGVIACMGDGAVAHDATIFQGSLNAMVHNVDHPGLLSDPGVEALTRNFLAHREPEPLPVDEVIRSLRAVSGMTSGERDKYCAANPTLLFEDGHQLLTIDSRLARTHVFIVDRGHYCRYAGYVGRLHRGALWKAIHSLAARYPLLIPPLA